MNPTSFFTVIWYMPLELSTGSLVLKKKEKHFLEESKARGFKGRLDAAFKLQESDRTAAVIVTPISDGEA